MAQTATVQIQMPEMGESVTEGIVLEWHVAEGDFVNEGDTVVEVSTDKVDAEVPAPTAGTITKLIAQVDEEVPVGSPLAEMEPGADGGGTAEGSGAQAAGPVAEQGSAPQADRTPDPTPPAAGPLPCSARWVIPRPHAPENRPRVCNSPPYGGAGADAWANSRSSRFGEAR
ncbi:MAG: biotin/lipoyl-containing protein [Anaerolineales bacterium]